MVGDIDASYPDDAPVLFTRNLLISSMDAPIPAEGGDVSSDVLPAAPHAPFGGRSAFIFITKNGAAFGLYGELMRHKAFTNLFKQVDARGKPLTNPILRP